MCWLVSAAYLTQRKGGLAVPESPFPTRGHDARAWASILLATDALPWQDLISLFGILRKSMDMLCCVPIASKYESCGECRLLVITQIHLRDRY